MKKFYSLVAILGTSFAIAQSTTVISENFNALTDGGNTTSTGATAPSGTDIYANGSAATTIPNFPTGTKGYSAGGMIKLGTGSLIGSTRSKLVDLSTNGGNVKVALDVKGWTVTPAKFIVNLINDNEVYASTEVAYSAVMAGSVEPVTASFTGGLANSHVEIVTNEAAYRLYIDNIVITTETLGTANYADAAKAIKNTVWTNTAVFSTKGNSTVEVYNTNGQLVKSFEVNGNKSVNVSDLAAGVYVVKTTENGKSTSTKVVKK